MEWRPFRFCPFIRLIHRDISQWLNQNGLFLFGEQATPFLWHPSTLELSATVAVLIYYSPFINFTSFPMAPHSKLENYLNITIPLFQHWIIFPFCFIYHDHLAIRPHSPFNIQSLYISLQFSTFYAARAQPGDLFCNATRSWVNSRLICLFGEWTEMLSTSEYLRAIHCCYGYKFSILLALR